MGELIYSFSTSDNPRLSEVGGKGKALIEMTKAGFPVPEGIVLSVDFFEIWLSEIKETTEWSELFTEVTKEKCDELRHKVFNLEYTENQKTELEKHLSELKGVCIYAVRSSSPEEDLESTSFAGMYETYLGVIRENLETSIVKAFSSMLDYRVMEYKNRNNLSIENTCISVIIQKQIASDVSGIGFSMNPQNNCYDEVVINAGFGLGAHFIFERCEAECSKA